MPFPGFREHGERLAQGGHGAGDQGGADRLHPIPPEQLEQLQQPRQIAGAEFREGQPQAAVDLQIHPPWTEPIPLPVDPGGSPPWGNGLDGLNLVGVIQAHPPALLGPMAAAFGLGQTNVGQPAHGQDGRGWNSRRHRHR